jgi:hypothetical protein
MTDNIDSQTFAHYMLRRYPAFMEHYVTKRYKTDEEVANTYGVIIENFHYTFNWVQFHKAVTSSDVARQMIAEDEGILPDEAGNMWVGLNVLMRWIYNHPEKFELIII